MICEKFGQCVDYLSDPINGETNCCMCCYRLRPITVIKSLALQDIIIAIGVVLVGVNTIIKEVIFQYYLNTLASNTLIYGIVFAAVGGVIILGILIFYIANRKKNLKCFGLFYVILRTLLFLAITGYSVLLLICVINISQTTEPIYGFDAKTQIMVALSPSKYYGIFGGIIAYSTINHYFSFILYLSYKFVSEGYEYEKNINMQDKEVKQTFAPEWFRDQEVNLKKKNIQQNEAQKIAAQNAKGKEVLEDIENNKGGTTAADTVKSTKKGKVSKNQVVPYNDAKTNDDDGRGKSTRAILPQETDGRNTLKVINVEQEEGSIGSFNQLNQ